MTKERIEEIKKQLYEDGLIHPADIQFLLELVEELTCQKEAHVCADIENMLDEEAKKLYALEQENTTLKEEIRKLTQMSNDNLYHAEHFREELTKTDDCLIKLKEENEKLKWVVEMAKKVFNDYIEVSQCTEDFGDYHRAKKLKEQFDKAIAGLEDCK